MEFALSVVKMKCYLEYDVDSHLQLLDALNELKRDPDKDVQETAESCEDALMDIKKRTKNDEEHFKQVELKLEQHEIELKLREQKEEEEKKKKAEEEEEFKFDFQALIAEQNKKGKVSIIYS